MSRFKPHIALLICNIVWAMDYPFYNIVLPHYVHPMAMQSNMRTRITMIICLCLLFAGRASAQWVVSLSLIHILFTDMEGTELYEKMMEGSSEIGIRIKGCLLYTSRCV